MLSNCSIKFTKVPDHLMCNLKRSGVFTEKPDFVNLTVHSMEIPSEIGCHVSFEIMGIFIRCSCHAFSVEVQINHRYFFSKVIRDEALSIDLSLLPK